jgi:hypothetical protein
VIKRFNKGRNVIELKKMCKIGKRKWYKIEDGNVEKLHRRQDNL